MKRTLYIIFLFSVAANAQRGYKFPVALGSGSSSANKTPNWVNALDYGAVGDSATENTSAIQNAINALGQKGGTVYFPNGVFLSKKLVKPKNVRFKGESIEGTFLDSYNADTLIVTNNLDNAYAGGYLWDIAKTQLEDICLDGRGIGTVGFGANELANFKIIGVMTRRFTDKAWHLRNCLIGVINDCYFKVGQYGIFADATAGNATTLVKINNTSFNLFTKRAIDWSGGGQLKLNDSDFEGNGTSGDTATGAVAYHDNIWPGGLRVSGGWAEENYGTVFNIYNNVTVQSSYTMYPTTTVHSIRDFQDLGAHFEFATRNVYLKGTGQILEISACTFSGAAKSVISDGANTINYGSTKLNNGTTARGGATITQVGN